tara:strand:- start:184 stop:417 length:234 start_codon:yes stop_codon:yes gene_type:complete
MTITEKESIIWASGYYLTERLPEAYDEWTNKELDSHLLQFVWRPTEYHFGSTSPSAEQIWQYIENLAYDFRINGGRD